MKRRSETADRAPWPDWALDPLLEDIKSARTWAREHGYDVLEFVLARTARRRESWADE